MVIDKEELHRLYMEWVNQVADDCDWKTHFGTEEIVHAIAHIIETNPQLMESKKVPPCVGHAYMNMQACECCGELLDLDDTDWCDKCDRSIFDESPCKVSEKTGDYMYNWIKEKSGK
jgi:hypothetical protein